MNQELHREYLKSPVWKAKRLEALKFFGAICSRCGAHGTDVHHKTYARTGGNELMTDLEVMCRDCHEAHHRIERANRTRKRRRRKSANSAALFRYLTFSQRAALIGKFGLLDEKALYLAIVVFPRDDVRRRAAQMLGVDLIWESKHKSPANDRKGRPSMIR